MSYITTRDEQQIFLRDIGPQSSSTKTPIIMLHGFGMHSAHWLPFTLPLSRKQRFIMPDFRGFGQSHLISHNRDCVISNYADDLADIIEALNLKQFKLAGISMGAFVALQYQSIYGESGVDRYLHIDQSPRCINKDDWSWGLFGAENQSRLKSASNLIKQLQPFIDNKSQYFQLPEALRMTLWKELGEFFCSALSRPSHKFIARKICQNENLIHKLMPVENWQVYIHCLRAYIEQDYNMLPTLEKMQTPISLLVGLRSEMYPCGGQLRIADYNPHCEVVPFTKSGHTPLIDQPIRFLQELKRFSVA